MGKLEDLVKDEVSNQWNHPGFKLHDYFIGHIDDGSVWAKKLYDASCFFDNISVAIKVKFDINQSMSGYEVEVFNCTPPYKVAGV